MKLKQVKIWNALRDEGLTPDDVRLSVQLFDELVFTVHYSVLSDVRAVAESIMREQEPDFLPFEVGVKVGQTWREVSE